MSRIESQEYHEIMVQSCIMLLQKPEFAEQRAIIVGEWPNDYYPFVNEQQHGLARELMNAMEAVAGEWLLPGTNIGDIFRDAHDRLQD